ncbi:2-oxoacid:acceptor oxidoreductase family protein [Rhodobium gokarnense]|uniref:2-oxoacid:acceptor oxidoreductase family protein n=1 Tax=Rhodobium gokarnense TaxID=364296 RepID=UPI0022249671|nr:2-oxoacid:acceptor oxidoreductase family protein [Rhodobium gokarnense]
MFEIRIHGRGGQGVVTAAEVLSVAAFDEGMHAQAFPSFGSERMGAPVISYCRIDDKEIRLREPILEPDALIIQDPTLLHSVDVFSGLKRDGYILINSSRTFEELGIADFVANLPDRQVVDIGATEIAVKHIGRPVPNAALLGGLAAITGRLQLESVEKAIGEKFPPALAKANIAAAREAYELAKAAVGEPVNA